MDAKVGGKRSRTSGGTAAPVERKDIERRRRNNMKALCVKLGSLIPKEHRSKAAMTQFGSLDDAAAYIKKLKERMDEVQRRRSAAQSMAGSGGGVSIMPSTTTTTTSGGVGSVELEGQEVAPVVEVRYHDDSSMDVVLVCGAGRAPFRFHEVIAVLEEEGAEIVHANYSVAGHKIFCTIHSQATEKDDASISGALPANTLHDSSVERDKIEKAGKFEKHLAQESA